VNDHDTSVLTARLHQLADDLTPPLDVAGRVRDARAGHRRRRRTRFALLAVATVTAGVLVGLPLTIASLTSSPSLGVAGPAAPNSTAPDEQEAQLRAAEEALTRAQEAARHAGGGSASIPEGWESRAFQGVTFWVPPGARSADVENDVPVSSWTDGPSHIWNGPHLGGDAYSSVNVTVTEPFEGGLPPRGGGRSFTVPGAGKAYGNIEYAAATDGGQEPDRTVVWLEMLAGGRVVTLDAVFAAGPEGEQMAHDLVASIVIG
jgi:hypothetical protein